MRYKLRKDERHAQIAGELEDAGFFVADTSAVGGGYPDLTISRSGVWALVELKTPRGLKSALERLRPSQVEFNAKAKGPVIVAYNASQVVSDFNLLIKRRSAYAM